MTDRFEYLYAILDARGGCRAIGDNTTKESAGLPALLADGWRPVRETPFHSAGSILLVLERDARPPDSFGFPKA